jgi:hypothetical protein
MGIDPRLRETRKNFERWLRRFPREKYTPEGGNLVFMHEVTRNSIDISRN